MRRFLALLAALFLLSLAVVPADAATLSRQWRAAIGTGGTNGLTVITANANGTGRIDYTLKGLRAGATYRVEVRRGRCASLGSVASRPAAVTVSSAGSLTLSRGLGTGSMNAIWSANWTSLLAIRFVSGTSIRCGNFSFARATRVVVPGYGIDLPVVRAPSGYPYCNVAMYMGALNQPQEPGVTFIMAHARAGMFLPLLRQWRANRGANLIGRRVLVYTSNSRVHTYQIYAVLTVSSVQSALTIKAEQLWLQTSTGPHGTVAKLVVKARRIATAAAGYGSSHPTPHVVRCGY